MTALPPVLILAGGKATRLADVLPELPKILAPVDGVPFLDILLNRLLRQGFTQAHFCLGVMAEQVIDYLMRADMADLRVTASIEDRPLGTGGAILNALSPTRGQRFFVLNGDSLIDYDPGAMLARHTEMHKEAGVTLLTTAVADAARFGTVAVEDGRVTRFGEKSSDGPGRINAGVYLFDRGMFDPPYFEDRRYDGSDISLERQMLPHWVTQGRVADHPVSAPLLDIGTPEALAGAAGFLGPISG
ncbi:hypothetical protein EOI86_10395 [Hwanghaeella grinnelliae]|uniref:Nucleotidyl transferase domain-containing protein n=1 Tax=Hwanghaeella grinnelliae TaxID=2500179 RepID=A0A3S2VSN9_9PROT|nr:sugar phosphate nucleotidyltransferase [Hwanghaeella grinnelliae]RVU39609.1 hypothetical protein EOI86_10395 [Hwanghaeella grinnelliae]